MSVHSNCIECIGTIYELNLNIVPIYDTLKIKGTMIIKSNDKYIRFYINTNKTNNIEYYRLLETFGIQWSMIKKYDKDKYTLHEDLVQGVMNGNINGYRLSADNPTKVYLTATLTEYGHKLHYIIRDNTSNDFVSIDINGSPYGNDKFIIPSTETIMCFKGMKGIREDRYTNYKLRLKYSSGFKKCGNVVNDIKASKWTIENIEKMGYYNKKIIDDIIILKG